MQARIMGACYAALMFSSTPSAGAIECVPVMEKAVKWAAPMAEGMGCALAFELVCAPVAGAVSAGFAEVACWVGSFIIGDFCSKKGDDALEKYPRELAKDICQGTAQTYKPKPVPAIVVRNRLEQHEISPMIAIAGDYDIGLQASAWPGEVLPAGKTGMLVGDDRGPLKPYGNYTVKAQVKLDGKPDVHRKVEDVVPSAYSVVVEYKNGDYRIRKEKYANKCAPPCADGWGGPYVSVVNKLERHAVQAKVSIPNAPDDVEPLKLQPGHTGSFGKADFPGQKSDKPIGLKVKVVRPGAGDETLEIGGLMPGKHYVVVESRDGGYRLTKQDY